MGSLVAAASFKLQRQSNRPSKAPARGFCATSSRLDAAAASPARWRTVPLGHHCSCHSVTPPPPRQKEGVARVGVGRALGVPAASSHASRCLPCSSTAACPSNCRGSKQVASDSDEGYATRTSLPLLWGWPFSRQQDRGYAGVWCGAWGAHATDATTSFHACLTALRYVEGAFALTHARCTCNV